MIELLRGQIADAHFERNGADLTISQGVFNVIEKPLRQTAPPVFGRNANRRNMPDTVFDHHKNKPDHLPMRRDKLITQTVRFVQKIRKCVLRIIFAFLETTQI